MAMDDSPASGEAGTGPRSAGTHMPKGEVHVFDNWCKGCGLCIEFCPADVLVLGMDNRPRAIYPEKCTACRWCELHCPDFAIFVSEIDEDTDEPPTFQAVAEAVADAVADVFGDKVAEHAARAVTDLATEEAGSSGEIAGPEPEPDG